MHTRSAWIATSLFILLPTCASLDPEPVVCTMEARSTFAVTVIDSATARNLAPEAVVEVREGEFVGTLEAPPGPNAVYSGGVYERPGVYTVMVTHPGYAPWRMTNVEVTSDECHVITRSLTARLQREG